MMNKHVADAIEQIELVRDDCDKLLKEIKAFSPPNSSGHYNDTFRLIATPMLYSAWERCFTLCHAIALRLIRDATPSTNTLHPQHRTIWLINTPFYRSLVDQLQTVKKVAASKKIKKGEFNILCEFLPKLDEWLINGLDKSIDTDGLVMTFSNVNSEVVEVNARAIGLTDFQKFNDLKLGRLHDLVGQRNDIGHGAIIKPPSNANFIDLLEFTENLVQDYCNVLIEWMPTQFVAKPRKELPKRAIKLRKPFLKRKTT